MAGAPTRTARPSDFSSVRDDYSSWLDEIFPPSRSNSGDQPKHNFCYREQQAHITAKLRNALPMELPLMNKRFVAQNAARELAPKYGEVRAEGADGKWAWNAMQDSRQSPPPKLKRSTSLPCSTLPVRHHRHLHRPFERRTHAALILATESRHPATFPDTKYGGGRLSHRPGLSFFEYIPSRAFINMANTVVFLGPEEAKRAGGEVLWLRTNAAGIVQRRVISSARCFVSSPKLRRRVALSLCGRDKVDGTTEIRRASASAPAALRRLGLGAQAVEAGTSCYHDTGARKPAAVLKIYKSCSRQSGRFKNNGENHNGRKREVAKQPEGGGSTDTICLDNLSEIEEVLLKAGEGEEGLSEERPDTAAQQDERSLPPDEPNVGRSCNNDGALGARVKDDVGPQAGAPAADEAEAMASADDHAMPPCSKSPKENVFLLSRRGLAREERPEEVQRPRPWAIQKYVRPKGPLAWVVRVVWRRNQDPFCWILSVPDPAITSDISRGGGVSGRTSWSTAVRSIAGRVGWEAPKAFVADMVAALELAESAPASTIPLRFSLMAVDLIEDRKGKWWLTQVKAFRLLRPLVSTTPEMPALLSVPETAIAACGATSGSYGDEARKACRVAAEETETSSSVPPVTVTYASALSKAAVGADTAVLLAKASRTQPLARVADLKRRSPCPGVYCKCGGETLEARVRQTESNGILLAPEKTKNGDLCADTERAAGEEMTRTQDGRSRKISERDALKRDALAGPKKGMTSAVGNGGSAEEEEAYPMFQLPLKALVVNDEIVRLRRASITRHNGGVEAAVGRGGGRSLGCDVVPAKMTSLAQNLTEAAFFDEPSWARGSNDVSLQGTSDIESRAMAALRKRDRIRLYDNVPLCATCYREYSENWRWWLARGKESTTVHGVQPQAIADVRPTKARPKLGRSGRRAGRTKQYWPAISATGATTSIGADSYKASSKDTQGRSKGNGATLPRKAPTSLLESPAGAGKYTCNRKSDTGKKDNGIKGSSCESRRTATVSRPGKILSETPELVEDGGATSGGVFALQNQCRRESDVPKADARGAGTSTLDTFRARLDRRLEGISFPCDGQKREKHTGEGLKNAVRQVDGADRQQEEPSSADSTSNVATKVPEFSSSSVAAKVDTSKTGDDAFLNKSRELAVVGAPVARDGLVVPADVKALAEAGTPRDISASRGSNRIIQEPADKRRTRRRWEWEKVTLDWNPTKD